MLISVEESVVSFMNKDIIDISIGSVNPAASASNGCLSIPSIVQLSMSQFEYFTSYAENKDPFLLLISFLTLCRGGGIFSMQEKALK